MSLTEGQPGVVSTCFPNAGFKAQYSIVLVRRELSEGAWVAQLS